MTIDEFWKLIEQTRRHDSEAHEDALVERLVTSGVGDILDFVHWWEASLDASYSWDLWGAAELINGGCSDDGFQYFREWLVLQGREVFQAAVADPDSLAEAVDPHVEGAEWECHPGMTAWFNATGTDDDDAGYEAFAAAVSARHPETQGEPELLKDTRHDTPEDFRNLYPRLFAMLGGTED